MNADLTLKGNPILSRTVLIDVSALALVLFTPALTHLLSFPLYLIEPMRIMLVLAIAHTRKWNAFLLALSLPLFSFMVSGHPLPLKMVLIMFELGLNVLFFYFFINRMRSASLALFSSIILSKAIYYLAKFGMISLMFLPAGLVATPLWIQAVMAVILSLYFFYFYHPRKH